MRFYCRAERPNRVLRHPIGPGDFSRKILLCMGLLLRNFSTSPERSLFGKTNPKLSSPFKTIVNRCRVGDEFIHQETVAVLVVARGRGNSHKGRERVTSYVLAIDQGTTAYRYPVGISRANRTGSPRQVMRP